MLGTDHPAYIIAEIGANFNGSLDCLVICDAAKKAGANSVISIFYFRKIVSARGFSKMDLKGVHAYD